MTIPTRAEDRSKRSGLKISPGTYTAVVMNNKDQRYAGRLEVWVSSFGGDPSDTMTWKTVSYANPFYGITPFTANKKIISDQGSSTNTPKVVNQSGSAAGSQQQDEEVKSFGMWVQPPEVGTRVLVTFTEGDDTRGFWFAAVPEIAHGMIPAIAKGESGKPEVEFDPSVIDTRSENDLHKVKRNEFTDETKKFEAQGLQDDEHRGFVTSSSFRESPSKVMGFNTPSGHSFVMDDGDEESKSKLIRIRTSAGNQITMNDDTGMIYVINAKGTGWLELSPSGHLDVYAEAGINLATKKDINLHADNDVNIHAGNNIKMVAMKGAKLQGTEELQLHGKKTMIEGVDSLQMHSCQEIIVTSFKDIYMKAFENFVLQGKCWRWNSGYAKEAEQVPPEKTEKISDYDTTVKRAPNHEPYKEHDNGESGGGAAPAGAGAASAAAGGASGAAQQALGSIPGLGTLTNAAVVSSESATLTSVLRPDLQNGPGSTFSQLPTVPATSVTRPDLQNGPSGTFSQLSTVASTSTVRPDLQTGAGGAFSQIAGADPVAIATQALGGLGAFAPASNIPAGMGGGQTGFAKGENCARPSGFGGNSPGSGGLADNLDTTLGQTPEDLQTEYDNLRAEGLTHEQAIGAMANVNRESGFRPGAIGDNGNSFGKYQFNDPAGRAQPMINAVPDWQTNSRGQDNWMFNGDSLGVAYKNTKFNSSLDAANHFTNRVEIPANRASYTAPGGYNSRIVPQLESSIIRRP